MGSMPVYAEDATLQALAAQDYAFFDISPKTGFLDIENTAHEIPSDLPESQWEFALAARHSFTLNAQCCRKDENHMYAQSWYSKIEKMSVIHHLSPTLANSKGLLRRSHVVLCMLGHFYMHGETRDQSKEVGGAIATSKSLLVPESIAVPWMLISDILGVKPILSYASEVLWNCKIPPTSDVAAKSIQVLETFTHHQSEIAFVVGPARVEFEGANVVKAIFNCVALYLHDTNIHQASRGIALELARIEKALLNMITHLRVVMKECEPDHFYWKLRPWIAGTGPGGWKYDTGRGSSVDLELAGSTAGTSSLLQALDSILGVEMDEERRKFRHKMQEYMPTGHRLFVQALEALHGRDIPFSDGQGKRIGHVKWRSIRTIVLESQSPRSDMESQSELRVLYNNVLRALEAFRALHFQIVTLFIINQASKELGRRSEKSAGPLKGTGGSDLAKLLKGYREASKNAVLMGDQME